MAPDDAPGGGGNNGLDLGPRNTSREYQQYQEAEEAEEEKSLYEKIAVACSPLNEISLKDIPLMEDKAEDMEEQLQMARMNIDTTDIGSMLFLPLVGMLVVLLPLSLFLPLPLLLFSWSLPVFWAYWVLSYPDFKATVIKIKSSDEALRVILYMAMYLDMTPSLEGALRTAAQHSDGPISKDLAKILWDTQTQKYVNIKEGIAEFMPLWRKWSPEFVKSFEFLIDSVSQSGENRTHLIKKAQEEMIESTKEKMSNYARDLSTPVKVIHMAGIVLPLMGLIMFPMITVFLGGQTSIIALSSYLAFGYLIVLPAFLFFLVKRLISKRPGAYAAPSLKNVLGLPPEDYFEVDLFDKTWKISVKGLAYTVGFIIMIPGILYFGDLFLTILARNPSLNTQALGYEQVTSAEWRRFISQQYESRTLLFNVMKAITVFWGVCAGALTYFLGKSYRRKQIRERVKEIEDGIDVSLTELQNSLSKSMPIERAIYTVINKMETIGKGDHPLYGFYTEVLNRMEGSGLNFSSAVFDEKEGAILYYPSNMLRNAMKVIINTVTRGPQAIAEAIKSVNEYISNHKKVEQTIKKLLDEVVSQMEVLGRFIAPIITSIAAAMSLLVVGILTRMVEALQENFSGGFLGQGAMSGLTENITFLQNISSAVPPTITLLIISLYLFEVAIILGYFTSGINHGFDRINLHMSMSKTLLYAAVVFSIIVVISPIVIVPFLTSIAPV